MDGTEGLSHKKWECKYHVVFIPADERVVWGTATALGRVFRKLAQQKESRIEEGHLMPGADQLNEFGCSPRPARCRTRSHVFLVWCSPPAGNGPLF
jgi:putative transposase